MIRRFFAVSCLFGALTLPAELFAQPSVTMTDLGTLPGGTYSNASAVNQIGDAVGQAVRADGVNRAVLFRGGAVIDLGSLCDTPACPNIYATATDINDHGAVVGAGVIDQLYLAGADLLVDARAVLLGGLRGLHRTTNG